MNEIQVAEMRSLEIPDWSLLLIDEQLSDAAGSQYGTISSSQYVWTRQPAVRSGQTYVTVQELQLFYRRAALLEL